MSVIRVSNGMSETEVACPMCGVINHLPYDITNPSRRQLVVCGKRFGVAGNDGCGEEFAYHVTVAVTGHTAALGDWKAGPTVIRGEVDEPEDEGDRKAQEDLRARLSRIPVKPGKEGQGPGSDEEGKEAGEGSGDEQPAEVGDMVRRAKAGKPPLIGRRGREL